VYENDFKGLVDHILVGGFGFSRDLTRPEVNGLREKIGSLIRQAGELESMAMSGTASPKMAAAREKAAREKREAAESIKGFLESMGVRESRRRKQSTLTEIRKIVREELKMLAENAQSARRKLIDSEYTVTNPGKVSYPYGRNRGDVRSWQTISRSDGQPVSPEDMAIFKAVEADNHPLGGMHEHELSDDGMSVNIMYYRHTAG
jgi:hypothetical protein